MALRGQLLPDRLRSSGFTVRVSAVLKLHVDKRLIPNRVKWCWEKSMRLKHPETITFEKGLVMVSLRADRVRRWSSDGLRMGRGVSKHSIFSSPSMITVSIITRSLSIIRYGRKHGWIYRPANQFKITDQFRCDWRDGILMGILG